MGPALQTYRILALGEEVSRVTNVHTIFPSQRLHLDYKLRQRENDERQEVAYGDPWLP